MRATQSLPALAGPTAVAAIESAAADEASFSVTCPWLMYRQTVEQFQAGQGEGRAGDPNGGCWRIRRGRRCD